MKLIFRSDPRIRNKTLSASAGRLSIVMLCAGMGLTACQQSQANLTSPNGGRVAEEGLPTNVLYNGQY